MSRPPLPVFQTSRPPAGIHAFLTQAADACPANAFLRTGAGGDEQVVTYAEARESAERLASWLVEHGVERGDRVAILMRNRPELAIALFAVSMTGAAYVVMNSNLRPAGARKILDQSEPKVVISDLECAKIVDEIGWRGQQLLCEDGAREGWKNWAEIQNADRFQGPWPGIDEDAAALVFTSGSTGMPRGVTLSHHNILFVTAAIQERLRYRETDTIGCFLPLSFDYGLYQILLAAQVGACLHIGDPAQVGPRLPKILADAKITILPGVPTIYAALIALARRRPFELPNLRAITNTGERLPPAYIEQMQTMFDGLQVYVMFGLTECKRVSILLPDEMSAKGDSVGRPLAGTEVYAVDDVGRKLPAGEAGELVVRGRHIAHGYWRAPEETAVRFRKREPGASVELFTGDTGSVDAEGFIYFASRADDLIKHRGNRISPLEIENEACAIDGVVESGAFKRAADDTLHLFVTLSDSALTKEAILSALNASLEPAKVPEFVHIEVELPKSINGKIDRKNLQQRVNESPS
ncbi:MAG: amino acid adenylation domain-containing protein [Verrucomicrobiales bacterium]